MARENNLQIAQVTNLLSGGYGRNKGQPKYPCNGGDCFSGQCDLVEIIDGTCGVVDYKASFVDCDDSSSSGMTRTYTWRDADSARNSSSAQGSATVRDTWTSTRNNDNSVTITLTSTVTNISRGDIKPGTRGYRNVAVKNGQTGAVLWQGGSVNVGSFSGTLYSGGASVTRTFTLAPQQTSANYPMILVRSWVSNMAAATGTFPEVYVDEMQMGAIFRNNLPNEFEPPVLIRVDQTRRICDFLVDADFYFEPPNLNGGHLELQWSYTDGDWSDDRLLTAPARVGSIIHVALRDLIPTSCDVITVYWRARFKSDTPELHDSDYTYGQFDTLFIPTPWMTTPDIDAAECAALSKGESIAEFDHIVYYKGKPECKGDKC